MFDAKTRPRHRLLHLSLVWRTGDVVPVLGGVREKLGFFVMRETRRQMQVYRRSWFYLKMATQTSWREDPRVSRSLKQTFSERCILHGKVSTAVPYQLIICPTNLFLHLTVFNVTLRLQLGSPFCSLLEKLDKSSASLWTSGRSKRWWGIGKMRRRTRLSNDA